MKPISEAEQGPKSGPNQAEVENFTILYSANRYAEAELAARQLIQAWPNHEVGWKAFGTILGVGRRFAEALPVLEKALHLSPLDPETHNNLGSTLQALGRITEAVESYRHALELRPDFLDAHRNLAFTLQALGRFSESAAIYRRVLEFDRSSYDIYNNLGNTLVELGAYAEAEASFRNALELNPDSHEAHSNLSGVLGALGRLTQAEASCRRALVLNPEFPIAHNNLGNILARLERFAEAEASFRRAVELNPKYHEAYNNLGNVLSELGRFVEAEAIFRRALEIKPDYHGAHSNLGTVLRDLGRLPEAEASFRRALEIKPDYHEAHNNLGNTLKALGSLLEAHASYRRALEIMPTSHIALNNLGSVLRDLGRLTEAEAAYRSAIELKPEYCEAHTNLGNALKDLGRLDEAESSYRRALEIKPNHSSAYSNLLFLMACTGLATSVEYLASARGYEASSVPVEARTTARTKSFVRSGRARRRLRIGYVSGDFRAHPVSYFMAGILGFHDRSRIEVFAYPTFGARDEVTESIQRSVDHWHSLSGVSDEAAVDLISSDQIDVLVDLAGHTAHNRLGVFARRSAPVQCHYLGYFASTGLSEMDYWIGDSVLVPEGNDRQYSEEIWRLPRVWVSYASPDNAPEPKWQPGARGKVCLGSFNHLGKITERTIALWARVLHRVSSSYLLLKTRELDDIENQRRILASFKRHGIESKRIELLGRTAYWTTHMSLYGRLDIALDPIGGIAGGTTTCDALWMSVPVVALAGQRQAERMTTSMLAAIGHDEWAAVDEDEYVEIVARLAENSSLRKKLRLSLRDTMRNSPLSDAKGLARALEESFESMFDRWFACSRPDGVRQSK